MFRAAQRKTQDVTETISERTQKLFKVCQEINCAKENDFKDTNWDEIVYMNYGCTPEGFVNVCTFAKMTDENGFSNKKLWSDLLKLINFNMEPDKFKSNETQREQLYLSVTKSFALKSYNPELQSDILDLCEILKRNQGAEFALLCETMETHNDFCSLLESDEEAIEETVEELERGVVRVDFLQSEYEKRYKAYNKAKTFFETGTRAESFVLKNEMPEAGDPFANMMQSFREIEGGLLEQKNKKTYLNPNNPSLDNMSLQRSKELKEKVKEKIKSKTQESNLGA